MLSVRRSFLLVLALGCAAVVLAHAPAGATPVQDPGTEVIVGGQVGTESSTTSTAPVSTTTTAATSTTGGGSTTVEEQVTESKPESVSLVTESRKVMAIIGGLVFVALALLLLTIRYWKSTKPVEVAAEATDEPLSAVEAIKAAEALPVLVGAGAPATQAVAGVDLTPSGSIPSVQKPAPGTDHASADDDWQPRTGELPRVEVPKAAAVAPRPSRDARRKALGLPAEA